MKTLSFLVSFLFVIGVASCGRPRGAVGEANTQLSANQQVMTTPVEVDEAWEALRREALERPRRVIYDTDGDDAAHFPAEKEATVENFLAQRVEWTRGSQIDTLVYCPVGSVVGPLTCRTTVTDMLTGGPEPEYPHLKNITADLLRQGADPVKLVEGHCRREGLEFFVSLRMNDTHDAAGTHDNPHYLFGRFKKEHPEALFGAGCPYGAWSAVDYAQACVRQQVAAVVRDIAAGYDIDGIEYDFMRMPSIFATVGRGEYATAEQLALFTAFMRELRGITEAAGRKRGRPILVAARVPDSLEFCKGIGIDLEALMREHLVDIYIGGAEIQLNPWKYSVELAHKYGVKFYPSIDYNFGQTALPGLNRNSAASFHAQALAALKEGVDGLFFFNLEGDYALHTFMVGSEEALARKEKQYFCTPSVIWGFPGCFLKDGKKFMNRKDIEQINVAQVLAGQPLDFTLFVGDEPSSETEAAVVIAVRPAESRLQLAVNGKEVGEGSAKDGIVTYPLPSMTLVQGENRFAFSLRQATNGAATAVQEELMRGDRLLVGELRGPWRRLWVAYEEEKSEEIVDGAYRVIDNGSGATECANLLYPFAVERLEELHGSFDMQVEKTDALEGVVFRVADGEHTELLCFTADGITAKYAGKKAKFRTDDRMHSYGFTIHKGAFTLRADGEPLLFQIPMAEVTDAATRLTGNACVIERMETASLLFGSLSGTGQSVSRWKNLKIAYASVGAEVQDFCVTIRYP